MLLAILLLVITSTPTSYHRIEILELNHLYDHKAKHVLDQYIFWGYYPAKDAIHVLDYRLVKSKKIVPNGNVLILTDKIRVHKIYFKIFKETWTQTDPEVFDRQFVSIWKRKEL